MMKHCSICFYNNTATVQLVGRKAQLVKNAIKNGYDSATKIPRNKGKQISGLYASDIATAGWDSQTYGSGTNQSVALWYSCAAARHLVENCLGGTVDHNWMGVVHVINLYKEFANTDTSGNPLG